MQKCKGGGTDALLINYRNGVAHARVDSVLTVQYNPMRSTDEIHLECDLE